MPLICFYVWTIAFSTCTAGVNVVKRDTFNVLAQTRQQAVQTAMLVAIEEGYQCEDSIFLKRGELICSQKVEK